MIKFFDDISDNDFRLTGAKGYHLSKLYREGIPVPNGFVVLSTAYETYVSQNHLSSEIGSIMTAEGNNALKAQQIKALFKVDQVPQILKEQMVDAYKKLGAEKVAVRSSSTAEDLPGMSFAGQYDSYLNVSESSLLTKVVECWQSLWNEHALAYREKHGIELGFTHSVVVQQMVNAKAAGVLFTANPLNGRRDQVLINAAYGLGEAIVSGRVNPDQLTMDKKSESVLKEEIADKELQCQYDEQGTEYVPVNDEMRKQPVLTSEHLKSLLRWAQQIEELYGKPQDVEFAIGSKDQVYIVQSREITTLFPIEAFDYDGKLRAYFSAGTVLLGMKEPLTPLGFDMLSQMFPTILNVMTQQKKPLDNRFVKYAAGRLYVDMTYMLASRFVSKQFGNAFSGNDLPFKGVMESLMKSHGKQFKKQGIRFKIPWGILKYAIKMMRRIRPIRKIPMEKRYAAMIAEGEATIQEWQQKANKVSSLEDRIHFIDQCMKAAFILSQKQGLYCIEMTDFEAIQKKVKKWYGTAFQLEPLVYSLPQCITQELTIALNQGAKFFAEEGIDPTKEHPVIQKILDRFGHRSTIELDIGVPRWREEPTYLIQQMQSYMVDGMYQRNLADITEKESQAEALIADIYKTVQQDHGEKKAAKLKERMIRYRIAAGMREYPKYDIVRMLDMARQVMLDAGDALVAEGNIEQREDVFFLSMDDLLKGVDLKKEIQSNRDFYLKEMERNRIPRVVLNNGETYYSAYPLTAGSKVLQGIPLSPGVCEGQVRIVYNPVNATLKEGEILVTESTNPAWTPLFATAKGLIMEYGGPVSHGGIVAREYGIPAVVGIPSVGNVLKDGQRVRINGETGTVELLE